MSESEKSWDGMTERRDYSLFCARVIGEERYGNSPVQAHPFQLIEEYVRELEGKLKLRKDKFVARVFEIGKMYSLKNGGGEICCVNYWPKHLRPPMEEVREYYGPTSSHGRQAIKYHRWVFKRENGSYVVIPQNSQGLIV